MCRHSFYMTNIYETTIIVKPDLANDQMKSLNSSIEQFFNDNAVSIGYKEDWGIKNLKFSINKYSKGSFKFMRFNATSEFPKKFHKKFYNSATAVTGKIGDILVFNPLCPHFSHTNNTKSKRNTFLVTFNGKKDGDKYYLSDYDKKLSLKTRKKFIDDQ